MESKKVDFHSLPETATMRDIFDFCVKNDLYNLAQGMVELPPPKKLRQRAADVLNQDEVHQYRNRFGETEYRQAIQKILKEHYKVEASLDSILATAGVTGAIFSTLMNLRKTRGLNAKIGLMVPFYTYHLKQINEVFGKDPEFLSTKDDFTPDWDLIQKKLDEGLDLILLCNPGNPQGNVWSKENMLKLVEMTEKAKCILMLDEIYCDLVWTNNFFSPIQTKIYDHVVVCRGFSKTLGAQSWRVGYLVTSPALADQIMKIHDPIYISVPVQQHAIAQYLAEDYEDFTQHVQSVADLMQENWKLLSKALQDRLGWEPVHPEGSMYGLFLHKKDSDRTAVMEALEVGVGVAPGNIFWPYLPKNTKYVRIHCGISLDKTKKILEKIQSK